MRILTTAVGVLALGFSLPALAMPVSTFLDKATALKRKGPLAMFSGDLKLLTNQITQDSAQLRAENRALEAVGKRKLYCTPAAYKMDQNTVMQVMEGVPAAQRQRTSTKEALRAYLTRQHPCR